MDSNPGLMDALKTAGVERLRLRLESGQLRTLASAPDGSWAPAEGLLPGAEALLAELSRRFLLGGHERLDLVHREPVGLRFFCAVHSTARGPGAGGLRRSDPVTSEIEVIQDVLNLSRAMTYKNAVAKTGKGGSKLAIHNPPIPPYDREAWLTALAEEIDLSGTITGPDVGLTLQDLQDLQELSSNVTGLRGGGTAVSAAFGVHESLQACAAALGQPLNETHVAIHGMGNLGTALGETLAKNGATLTITDRDHRRLDGFLSSILPEDRKRCTVVAPYQILEVKADILVPCAVGGLIDESHARSLAVKAICGGANNQLAADSLEGEVHIARLLHDHGVIYVPDWMASAGGTIHGTMEAALREGFDQKKAQARIRRICRWLVDEILEESKRTGRMPLELAVERFLAVQGKSSSIGT